MNTQTHASASQELLLIPMSQLRPSARNVLKASSTSIPELASSIARVGPLQNLTVPAASDGEHYEVFAGRRRLAALKLLAKRRAFAKTHTVPCLVVPDASARTASLAENVQREAMHPTDSKPSRPWPRGSADRGYRRLYEGWVRLPSLAEVEKRRRPGNQLNISDNVCPSNPLVRA